MNSVVSFEKKGEFVSRSIAGETILVPVRGQVGDLDAIYNLNEVGTFIWEHLDGHTDVKQLADSLCAEFDVTAEVANVDTQQFLGVLEAVGIVARREGA
jgi:hypothetical protein